MTLNWLATQPGDSARVQPYGSELTNGVEKLRREKRKVQLERLCREAWACDFSSGGVEENTMISAVS